MNEITPREKFFAGVLLITALLASMTVLIGLWPDMVPTTDGPASYRLKLFHVHLIVKTEADKGGNTKNTDSLKKTAAEKITVTASKDTSKAVKKDTKDTGKVTDRPEGHTAKKDAVISSECASESGSGCPISLNILLLLMVSLGGFTGNMIYIASSFSSFIGSDQFKRNWLLWYFVKPFTATGLALALYFALRAGFLNSTSGSANINLYGIMIIAIFTGLFTDDATLKLKEIFETIFKPKDIRPDKMDGNPVINDVHLDKVPNSSQVRITVSGDNLLAKKLEITVNNQPVTDPVIQKSLIVIAFDNTQNATSLILNISDDTGKSIFKKDLPLI